MIIGKTITITKAKNKGLTGKKGQVIDETKNTITIRTTAKTINKTITKDIIIIKDQITTIEEDNG